MPLKITKNRIELNIKILFDRKDLSFWNIYFISKQRKHRKVQLGSNERLILINGDIGFGTESFWTTLF